MQHAMTMGELAQMFNVEMNIFNPNLKVIKLVVTNNSNPRDSLTYNNARWLLPSPNLPTLYTSMVYPGFVIFEAFNSISLGRGIYFLKKISSLRISKTT